MSCRFLLLLTLATSVCTHRSGADEPALQAAAALYSGVRSETLSNGLRVYLQPIPGSPVVTVIVAYKVGSGDEDLAHTGLAHYLEHLLFKGTDKLFPGDIDRITLRNGGANNAYTSTDATVYHFDFAADRWEVALEIEADRMRNVRIDARHEFDKEKAVVVAELDRNEDQPWDLERKAILPLLFGNGPYGHPTIGEREHVYGATPTVIKDFYDRWYYPNNAALVISGGFDPEQALAKIRKLFGPIPAGKLPERRNAATVQRDGPVHKEFSSKFEVPRLVMGFNTIPSGDPSAYALDMLEAILSGGKTGRLYRRLIEEARIADVAAASHNPGRYPGWFYLAVELLPGKDRKQAEELILAELQRLRDEPVSEAELKRVQRQLLASTIFNQESVHNQADAIARAVILHDLDYLRSYLPRLMQVTPADIQAAARKYLELDKRVVVWSVPQKGNGKGSQRPQPDQPALKRGPETARPGGFTLKDTQRVVLPNGLTVLLRENRRWPVVVATAQLRRALLVEPAERSGVAYLVGNLLDEGTPKRTGQQIAELIENVGGELSFGATGGLVKVLSPDRSLGLTLLFECLTQATFPPDVFEREKERLLSDIEDAERQPMSKAQQLYREAIYGNHPLGRPSFGRKQTVSKLTPEDCRVFHRRVFVPGNTIVAVVGDFDSKQVIEEITRLTAAWQLGPVPPLSVPPLAKPQQFSQRIETMPEAAQVHLYLGHLGIRRNTPDFFKLLVMDYVLGTGPGFTDRLSARLRDREGLGYSVSATITDSAGEEPGLFTCYIGTMPEKFAQAKQGFLEEIRRLQTERPATEEVADAKNYLLGQLPFQFTTNEQIAAQLVAIERYGLGLDYLEKYRAGVAAVTPLDVQDVAQRYLSPQRMVLIAVGALDAEGKPLPKPRQAPLHK